MTDPRIERLASLLVDYSLALKPGTMLRIEGFDAAAPLILAVHRAAIERGANPYAFLSLDGLDEILLEEGSDDQLAFISDIQWRELEAIDAVVTIWGRSNTRSFTQLDPDRQRLLLATRRKLSNFLWERIDRGEANWVGTQMPTNAHAQDAGMSLREYEDFVYGACHVRDGEDPVAHWRSRSVELTHSRARHRPAPQGRGAEVAAGGRQAEHARRRSLHEPARGRDRR